MDQPLNLSFDLTRQDWIDVNRHIIDLNAPNFLAAARKARRSRVRGLLLLAPVIIAAASFFIGRADATSGMYLEGALGGCILIGLMLMHFGATRNDTAQMRRDALRNAAAAEYGDLIGPTTVHAGPDGTSLKTAHREFKQAWSAFEALDDTSPYLLLYGAHATLIVIPRRAFPAPESADAAAASLRRWLDAGRAPPAARIAAYLADRDLPCPGCKYNLRGVTRERCPECGAALTIDALAEQAAAGAKPA